MMDRQRQRTFFYGFIIGLALAISPMPRAFYALDDSETFFRYIGLIISVISGMPLINDVFRLLLKDIREKNGIK